MHADDSFTCIRELYEATYTSGGVLTTATSYYALGGQRAAFRKDGTLYYLLANHLGSTSVVLDGNGGVVGEERFFPYGELRDGTWSLATDVGFTGQKRLEGTGLLDYRARAYLPSVGRFVSADTVVPGFANPQSLNRYSYVLNGPMRYVDPSGHKACVDFDPNGQCVVDPDWHNPNPWRDDPGYDPTTDSIPGWVEDKHIPEDSRHTKAATVWNWICSTGGWWGSGCPGARELATYLLWKEGVGLFNSQTNRDEAELAIRIMVGQFAHLFGDGGVSAGDLSTFTAFFDPYFDGGFTARDWAALMNPHATGADFFPKLYRGKVDLYWDAGQYKDPGTNKDVTRWWDNKESNPCTNCTSVLEVDIPVEGKTLYLGYVDSPP